MDTKMDCRTRHAVTNIIYFINIGYITTASVGRYCILNGGKLYQIGKTRLVFISAHFHSLGERTIDV